MTRHHSNEPLSKFEVSLTPSEISAFFSAIGWSLPTRPEMPPTLATIFRNGEFSALQKLGIPLQKVLHGEQKYKFSGDLKAGESYSGEIFLTSQYEKSGGAGSMAFYVFQTNLKNAVQSVLVECHTTIIVRGK